MQRAEQVSKAPMSFGLPQPDSFRAHCQLDPGEATAVEPLRGWPLAPLVWAGCGQEEVWVAQQEPCPQRIPEPVVLPSVLLRLPGGPSSSSAAWKVQPMGPPYNFPASAAPL